MIEISVPGVVTGDCSPQCLIPHVSYIFPNSVSLMALSPDLDTSIISVIGKDDFVEVLVNPDRINRSSFTIDDTLDILWPDVF